MLLPRCASRNTNGSRASSVEHQMIRMMVAVALEQHLDRHTEKARSLPRTGSALHQPGRSGVPEHVRGDIRSKTSVGDGVGERLFNGFDGPAIPFDNEALPGSFPTSQMRQQLRRQRHRRLSLVGLALPRRTPIENAAIDVDPSATNGRLQGSAANGARPCSGVEAHENKFGDVPSATPFRLHSLLHLPVAPRGPKQGCGFPSC
jgi:hypothetical protein